MGLSRSFTMSFDVLTILHEETCVNFHGASTFNAHMFFVPKHYDSHLFFNKKRVHINQECGNKTPIGVQVPIDV